MASTRVLLLIPHLGGGGAEQVTALLAEGLSPDKYDLHLGLVTGSALPAHAPQRAAIHRIGARRVRTAALPLLRLVRRLRPDVILSGMAHLNFLVLLLRPLFPRGTRILVRQNGTVSSALATYRRPNLTRILYRLLYPRSDGVICQSRAMAGDLATELGIAPGQLAVLPNPLDFARIRAACEAPSLWRGPGPHLFAVGRLVPEKGFDLLLEALASVRLQFPQADLVIAGDGRDRAALEALARRLRLASAVHFAGYVDDPCRFYPGATLFVLSSRQDAMPNALLEAAGGGLPLVAVPASGGVVEFLSDCPGAWLAPSLSAADFAVTLLLALRALQPNQRFDRPCMHAFAHAIGEYEALIDAAKEGLASRG